MNHSKIKNLVLCALFAAITAILAQVTIPLPVVPITGQTFAVALTATILGSRYGTLSMLVYALLGAVGLPVFSGMSGGFGVIIGPSGGYIIGFIVTAFVTGWILERTKFNLPMALVANIIGMIVTLVIGTIQLKLIADLSWTKALALGAYPFILVGLIKAALASWVGIVVRRRLEKLGLLHASKVETAA
ncbi:biotin transporter BioY [Sporolactobacillus spathodeae]|uniref:Biotin transporter n=1 Tax=Sporolactobacillus spathodeae TaxID=1465502 RepID=A0ABS2Q8H5_9BACL|nr:biotin transporter BioY [Sporolactobacillus spathodeae]MBM7658048.1 biotin transport system substrate-specific component [Sporolactobacillus spathodeae]